MPALALGREVLSLGSSSGVSHPSKVRRQEAAGRQTRTSHPPLRRTPGLRKGTRDPAREAASWEELRPWRPPLALLGVGDQVHGCGVAIPQSVAFPRRWSMKGPLDYFINCSSVYHLYLPAYLSPIYPSSIIYHPYLSTYRLSSICLSTYPSIHHSIYYLNNTHKKSTT